MVQVSLSGQQGWLWWGTQVPPQLARTIQSAEHLQGALALTRVRWHFPRQHCPMGPQS